MTIFANIILPFAPRIRLNVTLRWRIGLIFPSLLPISNKYNIHIAIIRLLVNYIFVTIAEVEVNFSLDKMYNIFFINLASEGRISGNCTSTGRLNSLGIWHSAT